VNSISAESLLRLPVRVDGVKLGQPVDVVLDREVRHILGVEVVSGDDVRRFLPLSAARIEAEEIAVASALTLMSADELAFYNKRGTTMRKLRGAPVSRARRVLGTLKDVIASLDGVITELVVADGTHVRVDADLRIDGEPRRVDAA
jgi:hypothetical protein